MDVPRNITLEARGAADSSLASFTTVSFQFFVLFYERYRVITRPGVWDLLSFRCSTYIHNKYG